MRLREPMMATLNKNWIDIPSESKTHQTRSIEASSLIKDIFLEYKDWLENGYGSTLKDVGDHISKRFKNALRLVGVNEQKHFHSLEAYICSSKSIKRHIYLRCETVNGTSFCNHN